MSLNIMVVDDQPDVLASLRTMLTSMGSEVLTFADSREAAERVKVQKIDAIFVDVQMPHVSGFELTALIRASMLNPKVPVVMLTDQDDIQTMRLAFKAGATYFLGKPVSVERVQSLFNAVLGPVLMQRRKHARLPFQASVTCSAMAPGGKQFVARILNISVSGMAIEGSSGIEVGQLLNLEFSLPSVDRPLRLSAKVQRLMPPHQFGVVFVDAPAADQEALQVFIFPPDIPSVVKGPGDLDPSTEALARGAKASSAALARQRSLFKLAAYVAGALLVLYFGYLWAARLRHPASAVHFDSLQAQKLACDIQAAPPSSPSHSDTSGDSRFLTLTPATIQAKNSPAEAASYTLTLNNQSGQELAFNMVAEDMVEMEGRLVHLAAGQLANGMAANVSYSSPTLSVPSGQTASVKVTLAPSRDSTVHAVFISWNGTDKIRSWRGLLVQASPGTLITFPAPAAPEANPVSPPPVPESSVTNYVVCQWRAP